MASAIEAQPYYFRHYPVENGLSNSTVYCSMQDAKGFMWFGTKDGLNRFDGVNFKIFHIKNDFPNQLHTADYIYCLYADKHENLWIGADKGLYKFNAEKERIEPFIDSLKNINNIQIDLSGQLWFIANSVIYRYNFVSKILKQFPGSDASSLCLSDEGNMWFSTSAGLLKLYDDATKTFKEFDVFSHSPRPTSRWIQRIRPGDKNSIFIGTSSQGFKRFDLNTFSYDDVLTYDTNKTTLFVRDILKNSNNEFWLATESGIYILNTDTRNITHLQKKFLDNYSLSDNAIYTLYKDSEGGIWAGTYFAGINYYTSQFAEFHKYFPDNSSNSISGNVVREICKDQYQNLWIGTEDGGLNKLNLRTNNITHFKPTRKKASIAYSNIHGLMADGNDLWIGTFEHGTDIMDVRTGKVKKHFIAGPGKYDLKSNFALCFLHSTTGKILIGSSNGLFYYNKKEDNFTQATEFSENFFVSVLTEDRTNTIWIGTHDHGVFWYNLLNHKSGNLNHYDSGGDLSNKTINDIFEDSNNNIWFATEGGGICQFNRERNTFIWYTIKNGLPANFVFKILEDDQKTLWISTSAGLVNLMPDHKSMIVYTQSNGLLNNQFNYHSGYKDEKGRLYFGSVKGMISFVPGEFKKNYFNPPVYITGLQVFNKEVDVNKDSSILKKSIINIDAIRLPYYQSSVSIDFAALSYVSPEMTVYKYKLDGLDKYWTTIHTNRKVYFTNLSPGKYVFRLKTSVNGKWNDSEKNLSIEILPPFYATRWAYFAYLLFGILLLYFLVRNYHKRQQTKKEKEIYESKIEFFTNVAHEIKTPLTLIKGPVENLMEKEFELPDTKEDLACLDRNTNRLINLVSQILDFRQTEIKKFSLDFLKVNVNEILYETFLNFKQLAKKRKLNYEIYLPDSEIYALADGEALQKIFNNLIGNAVKYAEKEVTISLKDVTKESDVYIIEFENDGHIVPKELEKKIFEPFYRIKDTNQKGTGIGLTLSKSLTELHNGSLAMRFTKKNANIFVLALPLKPDSAFDKNN